MVLKIIHPRHMKRTKNSPRKVNGKNADLLDLRSLQKDMAPNRTRRMRQKQVQQKTKVEESHVMIVTCGLIYYEPEEDIRIIRSFFTELVARSKPSKVFSTPRLMMRFLGDPNRPIKCIEPFFMVGHLWSRL